MIVYIFFFYKQKTAYEMRISDWSSDVCSSDLLTGLDERMTFLSEAQIFLLVEPLRLYAGNKARIGADGDIDMPGLERAHHFIAAQRECAVAGVWCLEPRRRMQRRQNDKMGDVRSGHEEFALETARAGALHALRRSEERRGGKK